MKECYECRNGENETDGAPTMFVIKNPEGGRVRRGYLCKEHAQALLDDGYSLTVVNN